MSRRSVVLSTVLLAIAAFAVAFTIAAKRGAPAAPSRTPSPATSSSGLPVMWQMPAFSFRDQNDRPTTAGELRGHVVIADFVFTTCTSICPLITAKMALLQRRLTNEKLRFVSFSVDPARDSPEVLKKYADEWRPGESRWVLLSTTPPELEKLAAGMFVAVEPGKDDIAHSNLFFLVDARGGVRGIYESDRNDAIERLVQDAETLLGPAPGAPAARGGATSGSELYAALGCGACHARPELAPPLGGLAGRRIALQGGGQVTADAAYIRESIVAPDAKLVAGSALRMPSYEKELTPGELDTLVGYVETLPQAAPPAKGSTAPAKTSSVAPKAQEAKAASSVAPPADPAATPSAEPTQADQAPKSTIATDPVCSMSVRVVDSTPRATHAGRAFYFCSEMCRERFVAEPARYMK